MKLHLPKLLLTAVLAACAVSQTAWASWGTGNETDTYYLDSVTTETVSTSDSTSGNSAFFIRTNNNATYKNSTVKTLNLGNEHRLNVDGSRDDGNKEFDILTIDSVVVATNGTATINMALNNKVKLADISGTLNISGAGDVTFTKSATLNNISMTNGSRTFSGAAGTEYTINEFSTNNTETEGGLFTDTFTVDSGVKVTADSINNGWGLGALTVNGELNVTNNLTFGSGNNGNSGNVINGTGAITVSGTFDVGNVTQAVLNNADFKAKKLQQGYTNEWGSSLTISGGKATFTESKVKKLSITGGTVSLGSTTVEGTLNISGGDVTMGQAKLQNGVINISGGELNLDGNVELSQTINLSGTGVLDLGEDNTITLSSLDNFDKVSYVNTASLASDKNGFAAIDSKYTIISGITDDNVKGSASYKYGTESITVTNGVYTVAGTVDGSTGYVINKGEVDSSSSELSGATKIWVYAHEGQEAGTLKISGSAGSISAATLLSNTEGNGNITLAADKTDLANGAKTKATGTLTIAKGIQLNLGNGDNQENSIASFNALVLDGGTIRFQNSHDTFQNLTVTANGGTIHVNDMGNDNTDKLKLTGTTTLNGNLTYSNVWNSIVEVEKLAGTGNLIINSANTVDSDNPNRITNKDDSTTFTINGKDAKYSGEVQMVGTADKMKLVVAENLGLDVRVSTTSGSINMTGVGDGNKVIMAGAVGALLVNGTIAADVEFTNYDSDSDGQLDAGLKINAGASGNRTFTGDISGSGNFLADTDNSLTLTFSGNVSEWTGNMEVVKGEHNVKYTGSATDVKSKTILSRGTGTANVTFDHSAKATVASSIADSSTGGGMHVTVKNSSNEGTTFTGSEISMRSLTIEDNTLASFTGLNTLTLTDLTMKSGAQLNVGKGVAPAATTFSNGAKVTGTANLAGGAKVSGLDLSNATVLTLNGIGEGSLVNVTGEFVLPIGSLTLNGNILETLAAMTSGSRLNVFSVGSFTLGSESIAADFGAEKGYTLDTVFTGHDLGSDYYLGYTAPVDGGLGTVYIGKVVPEPTTATLSLLALAGLAARRRRK